MSSEEQFRVGDPIDVVTGANTDRQLDFQLIGPVPLRWVRYYDSSRNALRGVLGWGHSHGFERSLRFDLDGIRYEGPDGRSVGFPALPRDGSRASAGGWSIERISLLRYVLRRREQPAFEYEFPSADGPGLLRFLSAPGGHVSLRYDGASRLQTLIDSRGRHIRVEYDPEGRLTGLFLTDLRSGQERRLLAYEYDRDGNLIRGADPYGNSFAFRWDPQRRQIARTDRRGYTFTFEYDASGRCVRSRGEDGLLDVQLEYRPAERATIVRRSDGGRWTYYYDESGAILQVLDPVGGFRSFDRDEQGRLTQETNAAGGITRYLYDADGVLTTKVSPSGRSYAADDPEPPKFPAHRLPVAPLEWEYGTFLPPDSCSPPSRVSASVVGLPEQARSLAWTREAASAPSETPEEEKAPWTPAPRLDYDDFGRLIRKRFPDGTQRTFGYDANGNVERMRDRDNQVVSFEFVSWNLVRKDQDGAGNAAFYWHSNFENLTSITDAGGTSSEYEYDQADRLVSVTRNGRLRERYRYDTSGNRIEKTASDGRRLLSWEYAPTGLPTARRLASGEEHRFSYDAAGRYLSVAAGSSQTTFQYGPRGELLSDLRDGAGVVHRFAGERLAETIYFDRFRLEYSREGDGSLVIRGPAGDEHRFRHHGGGLLSRQHSNGWSEFSQFDQEGRCRFRAARSPAGAWETSKYVYSGEGDLLRAEESNAGESTYSYDGAHRLISRTRNGETSRYGVDAAGNTISQPGLDGVSILKGNRLATANGESFEYDDRDHLSRRRGPAGEVRYRYDSRDMLTECRAENLDWSASYDALGRRVQKKWGRRRVEYWWDGDRLAAEKDEAGRLRLYVYVAPLAMTPFLVVDYDSADADPTSGRSTVLFCDHRATPRLGAGKGGEAAWRARVEPYGQAVVEAESRVEIPLRFPGHYFDSETGLHYNRFRYYSPILARYLQADPEGVAGDLNVYAYGRGNPLRFVDLRGLACKAHGGKEDPACQDCQDAEKARKRFQEDFAKNPEIFDFSPGAKKDYDPAKARAREEGVQRYKNGEIGQSVKDLDLSGKTPQEIDALLKSRGFTRQDSAVLFKGQPKTDPKTGEPVPMTIYTHEDGGMVRVKPDGDPGSMREQPHASKSVRNPPDAPSTDWDSEALKVDNQGNALPASMRDMDNPHPAGTPENKEFGDGWADTAHTFTQ